MDLNTKKQLGLLEIRNQELKREREDLRAKIKELEEQKADQEAQLNYQKSLAQKLEGFQPVRICNEETKFKVLINTEVEDGLFTDPVSFTFPDYKSMDDFIQMALIHGQKNIRFTIKKGED
jgi:hypothetical protein